MTDKEVDFYNDVIKQFIADKVAALTPLERRQLEHEAQSIILRQKQKYPRFQVSTKEFIESEIKAMYFDKFQESPLRTALKGEL